MKVITHGRAANAVWNAGGASYSAALRDAGDGHMAIAARVIVWRARGFCARLRGLIGRPAPAPGEALWLAPCRQVHTLGMGYPIDVVFLGEAQGVLLVVTLKPWRISRFVADARGVLELAAGEATRLGIAQGGRLELVTAGRGGPKRRAPPDLPETRWP